MNYDTQDFIQWPQLFRNDSAHTIPPFGCMIQKSPGVTITDLHGDIAILCDRPGATFMPTVFVNGRYAVTAGKYGRCCPLGNCPVAHDTGWTPVFGEAGGVKPDSFLLWKGYPSSVRVLGVASASDKLLLGSLSPITSLLCQATGTIAANSPSTAYKILAGTPGSETDAGFTTVPPARNYFTEPLSNGDKFFLRWINNGWAIIRPAPGSGNRRFLGALDADLASADSSATIAIFTALDGGGLPIGVTTATNTLHKSGQNASAIVIEEDLSTEEPTYHLMDVEHVVLQYVTQVRYDATSHKYQMKRQRATVLWEEAEGDWEDIHQLVESEVVEDVQDTGTELRETKKKVYVAEEEEGSSNTISTISDCEEE